MSHPDNASNIQDGGPGHEPTDVKETPFGERRGAGHQEGTVADVAPNASASPADPSALVALTPTQTVEVKSDVSQSRDYRRVPLTQEAIAGYGAVAQGGPKPNDGRKK